MRNQNSNIKIEFNRIKNWISTRCMLHFVLIVFVSISSQAQSIKNYKINYEKRVNINKLYPRWANYSKADKFHTENFSLVTDSKHSTYQRVE